MIQPEITSQPENCSHALPASQAAGDAITAGIYGELTADGTRIILAVTGDDWELDRAAAALRRLTPLLTPTKPKGMLWCPATWTAVTQLAHTFSTDSLGRWIPGPALKQRIIEEFSRRTSITVQAAVPHHPANGTEPAAGSISQPSSAAILIQPATEPEPAAKDRQPAAELMPRPYQLLGAAMIASAGKFLLFDDPGTGKTITSILGLRLREKEHPVFPMLIVVPSWDVADVWARHINDWAPQWPEVVMYGGADRSQKVNASQGVLVTTYATARRDAADMSGPLVKARFTTVICDEVHFVKNDDSKQSQAVKRIAAHSPGFLGLSGTPVTRDTGDLYPVLEAMEPVSWPSKKRFRDRYLDVTTDEYSEKVEGLNVLAEPEFRAVLMGQYRRAAKADVLAELPPKVYSVRRVELPPDWRKAYETLEHDMLALLPDGDELPVMSVLAQLTRLSQLASSAFDVEITTETSEAGEERKVYDVTLRAPSWKAEALLEILAERRLQPVAVFAVSKQLITIAGEMCEKEGYRCGYLTGGQARKARQDDIAAFQEGKLDVLLATAGAGSLGITLTAAGTAVFLQRSWEFDKALQPEDRLHRIGNHHDCVEIIDVIAKNTVDERVRELLRVKGNHLGQLVQDPRIARELLGGIR